MAKPLDEQVVVITGASSGIGRATALRLASKGASVVISARREEPLEDLVEEIRTWGGKAVSVPADVSDYSQVEALAAEAVTVFGRIDTWVNNAAVLLVSEFEKTDLKEARRVFDVNFWGEYHGCKAVLPVMKSQGGGTIINVTSATAKRPLPLMPVYSASKAAINGLSEAVRAELVGSGVEICIVMPASIDTPLYQHARSKEGTMPKPAPPIYPPEEVAKAIEMCAVHPKRVVYAGPAGQMFAISNLVMGGVLDKVLGTVRRPVTLSDRPKLPGADNLERPMYEMPATRKGGWRTGGYKLGEVLARVAVAATVLLVVRKLVRR